MGRRRTLQLFEIRQHQDQSHITAEHSRVHMGRAMAPRSASLVYSVNNLPTSGQHCYSQRDLEGRAIEPFSSSFRVGGPHVHASHSGLSYDSFQHIPAGRRLYTGPENNAGHVPTGHYKRHATHEVQGGFLRHTVDTGRGPYKRKSPSVSVSCERGSTSRSYSAGSCSNSSGFNLENQSLDYQYYHSSPNGLPHYRGGNLSIGTEGPPAPRNVRSRSRIDLEPNPGRTYISSYASQHYCSASHLSPHYGQVDVNCPNADLAAYNQNHTVGPPATHGRFQAPGHTGSRHEMNQHFLLGSTSGNGTYSHDSISSRHRISAPRHSYGHHSAPMREHHCDYSRRTIPSNRVLPGSSHFVPEATPLEHSLQLHSSRFSRPFTAGGWHNNQRERRSRMPIDRFQLHSNAVDSHDGISSEALMMEDHLIFHGSRNLSDQYGDMRLDIDNMSYEELLALEERIGNVSTGLSKSMISECLRETRYSDENQEETICAICLENYEKDEEIGTLKNCGHDYHVGCIERWLSMKNSCPICKAAVLADTSKQ